MRYWRPKPLARQPLVSVVVAAYTAEKRQRQACLCFLYSLLAQTYENWDLLLVHDGPNSHLRTHLEDIRDSRIRLLETEARKKQFGHPWRQRGIDMARGEYLALGNADNYLCPVYLEALLEPLVNRGARLAYCDLVHSHQNWRPFTTEARKHKIDLACFLAETAAVRAAGWPGDHFNADGDLVDRLVKQAGGRVTKVKMTLVMHN